MFKERREGRKMKETHTINLLKLFSINSIPCLRTYDPLLPTTADIYYLAFSCLIRETFTVGLFPKQTILTPTSFLYSSSLLHLFFFSKSPLTAS